MKILTELISCSFTGGILLKKYVSDYGAVNLMIGCVHQTFFPVISLHVI